LVELSHGALGKEFVHSLIPRKIRKWERKREMD